MHGGNLSSFITQKAADKDTVVNKVMFLTDWSQHRLSSELTSCQSCSVRPPQHTDHTLTNKPVRPRQETCWAEQESSHRGWIRFIQEIWSWNPQRSIRTGAERTRPAFTCLQFYYSQTADCSLSRITWRHFHPIFAASEVVFLRTLRDVSIPFSVATKSSCLSREERAVREQHCSCICVYFRVPRSSAHTACTEKCVQNVPTRGERVQKQVQRGGRRGGLGEPSAGEPSSHQSAFHSLVNAHTPAATQSHESSTGFI